MTWPAKSALAKGYGTDPDESAFQAGIISLLTTAQELPGAVPPAALTIASGAITPTTAGVIVDTEGGAATDDLTTINTTTLHDGAYLLLRAADASRVITVKHGVGVGAIALDGDADVVLSADAVLVLRRDGTIWREVRMLRAATAADLSDGSTLSVAKGGTGGTTEAGARSSLGLGSASVKEAVATSSGAADAGKVPALGAGGRLETGFVDFAAGMNASGNAPLYAARGWVTFTGTGTPAIRASGNVSSISDNGVGVYTVHPATDLPDANYAWCINGKRLSTDADSSLDMFAAKDTPPSVSALKIIFNNGNSTASIDPEIATVTFFR